MRLRRHRVRDREREQRADRPRRTAEQDARRLEVQRGRAGHAGKRNEVAAPTHQDQCGGRDARCTETFR